MGIEVLSVTSESQEFGRDNCRNYNVNDLRGDSGSCPTSAGPSWVPGAGDHNRWTGASSCYVVLRNYL